MWERTINEKSLTNYPVDKEQIEKDLKDVEALQLVNENSKNQPYIEVIEITKVYKYNPAFGDGRICECGHEYYRHFDTYEDMYPTSCKYCGCSGFEEKKEEK